MMRTSTFFAALLATASSVTAHLELTYPGTRGNGLQSDHGNSTPCVQGSIDDYAGARGCFPYGMEWMYPCGGFPVTTNRTKWPVTGGAVAFQPGWFSGHSTAFIYINIGIGTIPPNMSHPAVPVFQISGPTNEEYQGRPVCIPQVGMPANLSLQSGDNITIQVVEAAKHGAALFTCVDVTLTDNISEVVPVTPQNCYNDSAIGFNMIFTTLSLTNSASGPSSPATFGILSLVAMVSAMMFSL